MREQSVLHAVLVTTFDSLQQSLHCLVCSLYHEVARNGMIYEFPTDLAVRLLAHQLVIHSKANKQSRDKQRQALRLARMDLPSPIPSPAAFVSIGCERVQKSVKSTPLDTYERKIG